MRARSTEPLPQGTSLYPFATTWWLLFLRGIVAVAFGVLAFLAPGLTLATLVLLFGGYALVDGVLATSASIAGDIAGSRWWLAAVGLISILAGLATFQWPGITALSLLVCIATWAIVIGVIQIAGAIRLRRILPDEWFLILSGIVSVLFGIGVLVAPGAGAIALVWVIAAYAIVFGLMSIGFALRLWNSRLESI